MELKDFIKNTVGQISDAIEEYNSERHKLNKFGNLNPKIFASGESFEIDTIEFDVAITAGEKVSGSAGAKVNVYIANFGGEGSLEKESNAVNRIKFSLGVAWPYAKVEDVSKLKRRP